MNRLPLKESDVTKTKSEKILLILNPVSGRLTSKAGLFDILDELYRRENPCPSRPSIPTLVPVPTIPVGAPFVQTQPIGGDPVPERRVTVVPTAYRGHAAELARASAKEGYDLVICCGGDGTLNETISGLLSIPPEVRPELGYLPAGSTNDFATSMGLPSDLREAARTAIDTPSQPLDVGCFAPEGDYPVRNFSYIASFGVFTSASYSTPQSVKNAMGHVAYLLEGVKDLANLHTHHVSFDLSNGAHIEGDYVFGAVTNTTSAAGLVQLPPERVSFSDGQFEVLLVKKPKTVTDLNQLVTVLWSMDFDDCPLIDFYHTRHAKITLDKPMSWSLDGEEAQSGERVEISCLPSAVYLRADPEADK